MVKPCSTNCGTVCLPTSDTQEQRVLEPQAPQERHGRAHQTAPAAFATGDVSLKRGPVTLAVPTSDKALAAATLLSKAANAKSAETATR